MKRISQSLVCLFAAIAFAACGSKQGHDHAHDHEHGHQCETHSHAAEQDAHSHEHSHEQDAHSYEHEHEGCDHSHEEHARDTYSHDAHSHEADAHSHEHGEGIAFTKQQAEAAGLQVELIEPAPFAGVIKTAGHIQAPKGHESVVVATAAGVLYYANPSITEGMAVKEGKALAGISAKKLQDGDPLLKAKLAYETALAEYERALRLVDDKIVSAKEFEQIRLRYETAKTTYEGQAQGMTDKGAALMSPMDGYLKQMLVPNGGFVEVGQPVAIVTQTHRLQLRAEVSERDYALLTKISSANFRPSYTDKVYKMSELNGRLVAYGKTAADEASYYIPVTFEFDNVGDIVPGAFADVYLLTSLEPDVLSVPVSALTEEQGLYYVYVQVCAEEFMKRGVQLGRRDGERVEILHGLHGGERVVTQGAYQVKLASVSTAIPHGHSH
ncbi:MAG: efflux RND transporter periplasmic adaptor subunit [Bacteroidaceae bacterium]|nr:efflux RND transporter periplasmic adaptor subunit [Bacteroidaceae bacterium]